MYDIFDTLFYSLKREWILLTFVHTRKETSKSCDLKKTMIAPVLTLIWVIFFSDFFKNRFYIKMKGNKGRKKAKEVF